MSDQQSPAPRWQRIRGNAAWGSGAVVSLLLVLPLLRAAARLDKKYVVGGNGRSSVTVHTHAGLFLLYGLLAMAPALVAAVIGRKLRKVNVAAVVVVGLLACLCEAFVAVTSADWFQF